MRDDSEIWDEFKWEEFMKEQDKKLDRYMELFYRYQDDPNRDEIIAREMGWTWLLENGEKDARDEEVNEFPDEDAEGEEWKARSGLQEDDKFDGFRDTPVYLRAKAFAHTAMKFADSLPEDKRGDSSVVDFLSNAMVAAAKIAGGSGIGYDIEELGGNIAYCKRGLHAANYALAALREMNEKRIITEDSYAELLVPLTEVRNMIAVHVLDLREQFRKGI
ncbi:MAG TPA: hypothetical protein VL633_05070 [Bacteroidota bacterium]|nr:hypothetical protein [Bacteroidota bacterium]